MTNMKKIFLLLSLSFLIAACASSSDIKEKSSGELLYQEVDEANAIKGFFPFELDYDEPAIPTSMEFFYIPLNAIWTAKNNFDFSELEEHIEAIKSRGHQTVFRVYLDYPDGNAKDGSPADGTPSFFWSEGIEKIKYHHPDSNKDFYFPDYTNQKCIDLLTTFIEKLGQKYDGDPRLAYIFCGLIGHWGEWHNYYYTTTYNTDEDKMPSDEQQTQLYKAFSENFTKTFTLTRYPTSPCLLNYKNIGFHDDSFTEDTYDETKSWYFMSMLESSGQTERWKITPIGGEFRPENQLPFLNGKKYKSYYQDYDKCVELTHASSMMYDEAFYDFRTKDQRKRAWTASKKLAYDLYCSFASVSLSKDKKTLSLQISITNKGIAPFYYNWTPLLILTDEAGGTICEWENPFEEWNLPTILPEESAEYSAEVQLPSGAKSENLGNVKVLLGIPNPMEGGIPLKLANNTLNLDKEGFITLYISGE